MLGQRARRSRAGESGAESEFIFEVARADESAANMTRGILWLQQKHRRQVEEIRLTTQAVLTFL
jgi:hypothetical protein